MDSEIFEILALTLKLSSASALIAAGIGLPLGLWMAASKFPLKRLLARILHAFTGFPPVMAGLLAFFLLSRSGPLGSLKMLYTPIAMAIAQILIIAPIEASLAYAASIGPYKKMEETAYGMQMPKGRALLALATECARPLASAVFLGFGRAISEVGAAQIVGGNIAHKTRIMTTAIVLETNMGHFGKAAQIGWALLIAAFAVMSLAELFAERESA